MKTGPIIPEIVESDESLPRDLRTLRRFAHLMDAAVAIPGTRRRVGLDAAIGVIPGVGDAVGALMGTWIVFGAMRHRVPVPKIARMIVNILLDLGIGAIPIVGDIFDVLFSENLSNVDILIRNRDRVRPPRSMVAVALGIGLVVLIVFAGILASGAMLVLLINRMMGRG